MWFGGSDLETSPKRLYDDAFQVMLHENGGKLIQFMHTTMVPVQVKTMKIQAGVQVSRQGELRRHLQLWKCFGRLYLIVFVLVRNVIYEWNDGIPWVNEKPWTDDELRIECFGNIHHECNPLRFKNETALWPTYYEWYDTINDNELKEEALINKRILEESMNMMEESSDDEWDHDSPVDEWKDYEHTTYIKTDISSNQNTYNNVCQIVMDHCKTQEEQGRFDEHELIGDDDDDYLCDTHDQTKIEVLCRPTFYSILEDQEEEPIEEEPIEEPKEEGLLEESEELSTQISCRIPVAGLDPRSLVTLVKAKSNQSEAHHKFILSFTSTRCYR
ncbi:hypothetical protein Tco_0046522 [Tanacetum coccineum]